MGKASLRVLLVEDNRQDAALIQHALDDAYPGAYAISFVERLAQLAPALAAAPCDAILLDLSLPDSYGMDTLSRAIAVAPTRPIIVLTGLADETVAVETVRGGAQDYLIKGETDGRTVARAIRYAVERKRMEQELTTLNAQLEQRVADRTAEVRQYADRLRAMASELDTVEQRERRRLATVLHEEITQLLVGARLQLSVLQKGRASKASKTLLKRADEALRKAVETSRSLTQELSPPALHDIGLGAAFAWLARNMLEKHQLTVELMTDSRAEPTNQDVRNFLYDAVSEVLLNVVRHARVNRANVIMSRADGEWTHVAVEDEGVGFDPKTVLAGETRSEGFGLFSIQQRLVYLGGRLEIESAPGKGTRITLVAPLHRKAPAQPGEAPCA